MFKIFHRGHKVQFNEDELKKQENNSKRNSYFYTEDKYFEKTNEERIKANNLSVSNSNTKALTNQIPSKRYGSVQHLPKPNNYDEESDDSHGLKEKLMNRYTNVTTLLMRSFRKAKHRKKKENEEKRKHSMDVEGSPAIYRPINRDEIVRHSPKLIKSNHNSNSQANQSNQTSQLSTQVKNAKQKETESDDDDDDEDENENRDEDENDDEEDNEAVPVFIGVKKISDDFVDYPIKIGDKKVNETVSVSPIKTEVNNQNHPKPELKAQLIIKTESLAQNSKVQTTTKAISNHSKPQAPTRPTEIQTHSSENRVQTNSRLNSSSSQSSNKGSPTSKCTPLIGERKKLFESNGIANGTSNSNSNNTGNTISSGISLNKMAYLNSLSKKTAAEFASEPSKQSKNTINSIKSNKNFEKFNTGTNSMIMPQSTLKKDKEANQSSLSMSGANTSTPNLINKLGKIDKLTMNSVDKEKSSKPVTVKRSKTFTQQLNEMLEQYKKLGSNASLTSNDKIESLSQQKQAFKQSIQKEEKLDSDRSKNSTSNGSALNSKFGYTNDKVSKIQQPSAIHATNKTNGNLSESSAAGSVSKNPDTIKTNQINSKIPLSTNRVNGITTSNGVGNNLHPQIKTNRSPDVIKQGSVAEMTTNKYGIIRNTKDSSSLAKEAYLRSIGKNSAKSLMTQQKDYLSSPSHVLRGATTDTEIEKKRVHKYQKEVESDIYSNLKFPDNASDKVKVFSQKFYGDIRDKMRKESYIKTALDFDDYKLKNKKSDSSDGDESSETNKKIDKILRNLDVDNDSKESSGSSSTNDEFRALVSVLEKQDVDFKIRFFNCLMPKLWDASLPYEEYMQLNKLMTALFGEKYHELDQSTKALAEQLRRKSSMNKYDLKEQFEKSQAYENNIKRLIKDYLVLKSSAKNSDELDESVNDYAELLDDDHDQSYKSVNHLINTLKRRQIKDYSIKLNNPGYYTKLNRADSNIRSLSKDSVRSDYESHSDNPYTNNLHVYKLASHKNSFLNRQRKTPETKSSLFLQLREQDVNEDTDCVSKQSDIWTQSFEATKPDIEHIYGTVNYRSKKPSFYKNENSEAVRDKLRTSLQNFNQLKQEPASLKEKIQAFNRMSMSVGDNKQGKQNTVGYSPQTQRKQMKKPSYPDIVIESTLEDKNDASIIASFQPSSNYLTNSNHRISMSTHSMSSESKTSLMRPKSPSILANGGQRLQAYRPKLLTNQLIQPSTSSMNQDNTLISGSNIAFNDLNNESFEVSDKQNEKRLITKAAYQKLHRNKETPTKEYLDQKYLPPDILSSFESYTQQTEIRQQHHQQEQQNPKSYTNDKYFPTKSRDYVPQKSPLNSLTNFLKDNKPLDDSDYETFINRKQSDLMEKELMSSFNDFFLKRELNYKQYEQAKNTNLNDSKSDVYDKFEIYDALY